MTGKPLGHRSTFHPVASELESTARAYEYGTFYRHTLICREIIHIWTERWRVLVSPLTACVVRDLCHIVFRPQINGSGQRVLTIIPADRRHVIVRAGKCHKPTGLTVNRTFGSCGVRPDIVGRICRKSSDITGERTCFACPDIVAAGNGRIVCCRPTDTELAYCLHLSGNLSSGDGVF